MKAFIPIIFFAVSVGTFFLIIDPQYKEVRALKVKLEQYDRALETSNEVRKEKTALSDENKKIVARNGGADNEKLKKIIPKRVESIKFILDVSNMASKRNLFLRNISISSGPKSVDGKESPKGKVALVTNSKPYNTTNFAFSVSTSYDNFLNFLGDIQKNLEIMDITSVSFKTSDSNIYDFALSGNVYSVE